MSTPDKKLADQYFAEARSWETTRVKELESSRKTAWRVAGAAVVAATCAMLATATIMPLKEVIPFVVRVDQATGIVDVVKAMDGAKTTYDEAVNKYFLQWYVRYREGYARDLAEEYYGNVGLMSDSAEQQRYFQAFAPQNPRSPLNVYGDTARVKIDIKGTSFIQPNVALVRYTKRIERGGDQPQLTHWAATITFKYVKTPMKEKDRETNPLGFLVTDYRNDPDAVTPEATAAAQAPAPAPAPAAVAFPPVNQAAPTVPQLR